MCDKSLGTFINPFTDFGFKRLFGSEESKPFLISFLNDLLPIEDKIISIEFKNIEKLGVVKEDRKAIFDLYCKDKKENYFIVELQRVEQEFFQDRAIYYSTFPIQEQSKKGYWDFKLAPIYFIGILDFSVRNFDDENYLHYGQITDIYTKKIMYDKLSFIYIEMTKFKKQREELSNHLEKWLYFLRNLVEFDEVPSEFKGDVIEEAFEIAKLSNMSFDDRHSYEISLKYYRDFINSLDTVEKKALSKGFEKGEKQAKIEIAKNALLQGIDIKTIISITGLSEDEVEKIKFS